MANRKWLIRSLSCISVVSLGIDLNNGFVDYLGQSIVITRLSRYPSILRHLRWCMAGNHQLCILMTPRALDFQQWTNSSRTVILSWSKFMIAYFLHNKPISDNMTKVTVSWNFLTVSGCGFTYITDQRHLCLYRLKGSWDLVILGLIKFFRKSAWWHITYKCRLVQKYMLCFTLVC